jgi:hypothetical protein
MALSTFCDGGKTVTWQTGKQRNEMTCSFRFDFDSRAEKEYFIVKEVNQKNVVSF